MVLGCSPCLGSAELGVTDLTALPKSQGSFGVEVVLELQPVVTGIDQKKGVMLQGACGKPATGLQTEAQTLEPGPLQQGLPGLGRGKHESEMTGIDARLWGLGRASWNLLGHHLMAAQIEDQGMLAAAAGDAAQAIDIPAVGLIEIPAGNRKMEPYLLHEAGIT